MFQERLKQALWQVPILVIMAGLIALGVNQWRTDGIALIGNWSVEARFSDTAGESLVVSLDQAGALFEQDAAVVHILFNGWTVWQQAGLPIEGGLK